MTSNIYEHSVLDKLILLTFHERGPVFPSFPPIFLSITPRCFTCNSVTNHHLVCFFFHISFCIVTCTSNLYFVLLMLLMQHYFSLSFQKKIMNLNLLDLDVMQKNNIKIQCITDMNIALYFIRCMIFFSSYFFLHNMPPSGTFVILFYLPTPPPANLCTTAWIMSAAIIISQGAVQSHWMPQCIMIMTTGRQILSQLKLPLCTLFHADEDRQ